MADGFAKCLAPDEAAEWASFETVHNFLCNHRSPYYKRVVDSFLQNYQKIGGRMYRKIHFLDSHIDFFPRNLSDVNDGQGERLRKAIPRLLGRRHDE